MSTPLHSPRRERLLFGGALVAIVAVYVAGALWMAQTRSVWSPDTGARLIQVQSVLSHWPDWQVAYPGASLDPDHRNSPLYFYEFRHDGRTYIFYSFLFALLSAAFFKPLGFFGLAVLPMLGGVATALATYGLARLLRLRCPVVPMLLTALVSPLVIYSVVFWDHSVTTGVAAVALWLGARGLISGRIGASWLAAGALLGIGLWFHEVLLPFPVALAAGAFWVQRRRAVKPVALLFAGTLLTTLPLMLINQRVYGTPFGPHLSNLNEYAAEGSLTESLTQPLKVLLGAFYTLFGWGDVNPFFNWHILAWLTDRATPFRAEALRRELTVSGWLALPYVMWVPLALSGWWSRRPWGVCLSLLLWAGMAAGTVWLLRHTELTHSLFFVFPPLALAFAVGSLGRSAEATPRRDTGSP